MALLMATPFELRRTRLDLVGERRMSAVTDARGVDLRKWRCAIACAAALQLLGVAVWAFTLVHLIPLSTDFLWATRGLGDLGFRGALASSIGHVAVGSSLVFTVLPVLGSIGLARSQHEQAAGVILWAHAICVSLQILVAVLTWLSVLSSTIETLRH
jgi:hypothetical protein